MALERAEVLASVRSFLPLHHNSFRNQFGRAEAIAKYADTAQLPQTSTLSRAIIARSDSGNENFNVSNIIGAGASAGISRLYNPSRERSS